MTLQQLTYLVAIQEHFGINEAAKACNVVQPTVTIPKELKAKPINRDASPVQLTELGDLIARQTKIIFKNIAPKTFPLIT
jgi:DNA-binding transcriptional LysR family regulator